MAGPIIIAVKVFFCIEPLRNIEIKNIEIEDTSGPIDHGGSSKLPLTINTSPNLRCETVRTKYNVFIDLHTNLEWRSTTAGLWIGQEYTCSSQNPPLPSRYLSLVEKKLDLTANRQPAQSNEALQREFITGLLTITAANKVPSSEFIQAIEETLANIKPTMNEQWFRFGTKDINEELTRAKANLHKEWISVAINYSLFGFILSHLEIVFYIAHRNIFVFSSAADVQGRRCRLFNLRISRSRSY